MHTFQYSIVRGLFGYNINLSIEDSMQGWASSIILELQLNAPVPVWLTVPFRCSVESVGPVVFPARVAFAPKIRSGGRIGTEWAGHCRTSP